jgi:DNA-binding PadR family transcriptional regulator
MLTQNAARAIPDQPEMPAMLPSTEAQRLQIVQRTARFVLATAHAGTPFDAWGIFPPDQEHVDPGTPEYSWRDQLAWTWAKAGYFRVDVTGKGTRKHRTYTLTPLGRAALERIADEPALASFYITNKRIHHPTSATPSMTHYQPPELRVLPALRSVPNPIEAEDEEAEAETEDEPEPEAEEVGEEEPARESGSRDQLAQFNTFIEGVTRVLESMNKRLVAIESDRSSPRLQTLEYEVHGFTDLMLSVAERLDRLTSTSSPESAVATRGDLGRASAELVKAFASASRPDSKSVAPPPSKLDEAALASSLSATLRTAVTKEIDARVTAQFEGLIPVLAATARDTMREKAEREDKKNEKTVKDLAATIRAGVREEITSALGKVDFKVDLSGFGKKLEESIAERLNILLTGDPESVSDAASAMKEDLALIRKSAEKLGVNVATLIEAYEDEHAGFRRTGEIVSQALTNASHSALSILGAAKTVANEMMLLSSDYAKKNGVPREVAFARGDAALAAFGEAEERLIADDPSRPSLVMAPKPIGAENLRPVILQPKPKPKGEKS